MVIKFNVLDDGEGVNRERVYTVNVDNAADADQSFG